MKSDTRVFRDGTSERRGDTVFVTGSLTDDTRTAAQVFTWENDPPRRASRHGKGDRRQGDPAEECRAS
ncbi:hypothetical protein OG426_05645 [Streptomyces canus]|uniref:hypothetical protein n=1 Tax=Streptomyces canus TaxID=58343 RepID=UPI0038697DB1|nr:hypothetical protein OG426_05645 [Streptomyces canus]